MTVKFAQNIPVKVTEDRVDELIDLMHSLARKELLVGIPAASAGRVAEDGKAPDVDNATLGYVHEYGLPEKNIPPRPFLIPGVQDAREPIAKKLEAGARQGLGGDRQAAENALDAAGLIAQSAVRRKITEGPFVPLAPRTLAGRRARGRTGEKPLIDTGQLRRSVTYVIREVEDDGETSS